MKGPLDSGCPKSNSPDTAATQCELPPPENPDTVPLPAAGDEREEGQAPSSESAGTLALAVAAPTELEHGVEEELTLVPVEVEDDTEVASSTPALPLVRRSPTATEEAETALQAPEKPEHASLESGFAPGAEEPDHARLRENAV